MLELFLLSMLLGLVAGLLAGLMGLGGGVIIVPALIWLFSVYGFVAELIMIMAIATSLATIVFTAIASILTHQKLGAIQWGFVFRLMPGIVLGAGIGAMVADFIDAGILKKLFVVYLLFVATRMAWPKKAKERRGKAGRWVDYLMGNIIGFVSSIIGIGGGTLTVPYLLSRQLPMKNAVAVSSACGLPIAISGVIAYVMLGWNIDLLPRWSFGYVYLPAMAGIIICSVVFAPVGARLANKLPARKLKKYFSIVLFLIALKMIFG